MPDQQAVGPGICPSRYSKGAPVRCTTFSVSTMRTDQRRLKKAHVVIPAQHDEQHAYYWREDAFALRIAVIVHKTPSSAFVANGVFLSWVGTVQRKEIDIRRCVVDPPLLQIGAEEKVRYERCESGRERNVSSGMQL